VTVYVDQLFVMEAREGHAHRVGARHGHRWCHLLADDLAELLAFAARLGMRAAWLQRDARGGAHFDLVPPRRARALELGAKEITARDAVQVLRRMRAAAKETSR
jgi:hypothetical protein